MTFLILRCPNGAHLSSRGTLKIIGKFSVRSSTVEFSPLLFKSNISVQPVATRALQKNRYDFRKWLNSIGQWTCSFNWRIHPQERWKASSPHSIQSMAFNVLLWLFNFIWIASVFCKIIGICFSIVANFKWICKQKNTEKKLLARRQNYSKCTNKAEQKKNSRSSKIMPTAICNAGSSFQMFVLFSSIFQCFASLHFRSNSLRLPFAAGLLFATGGRSFVQSLIRHMLLISLINLLYFWYSISNKYIGHHQMFICNQEKKNKKKLNWIVSTDQWVRWGGAE